MDKKLTLLVVAWVSGFIAGVIFVASWWRMGGHELATAAPAPAPEEASTASGNPVNRAAQRVAGPVVAAARVDVLRVRDAIHKRGHRDTPTPTVDVRETADVN